MSKESAKEFAKSRKAREVETVTLKKDSKSWGLKKGDKVTAHKSVIAKLKKAEVA